ncbi:MAG: hypothetical protein ABI624_10175 [Casimicrobiaceae bacterium]
MQTVTHAPAAIAHFPQRKGKPPAPALPAGAEVDFGDPTGAGELVDYSSESLAFRLPAGFPLSGVCRDAILRGVHVRIGQERVLGPVDLEIRTVGRDRLGYRVECAFLTGAAGVRGVGQAIRERTRIAALVCAALQESGIALRLPGASAHAATITQGDIDSSTFELTASVRAGALRPLDIVEGGFDLNHTRYEFTAVVRDVEPLRIRLPNALASYEHRLTARQRWTQPATLRLVHPLHGQPLALAVCDISPEGIGVVLDRDSPPFPRTLRVGEVTLDCNGRRFHAHAEVRHIDCRDAQAPRVGLHLEFASPDEQARFAQLRMRAAFPMVESPATQGFDETYSFVDRAGAVPRSVSAERVRPTLQRLHEAPASLCRTSVMTIGGEIVAHGYALKRYIHTWTMQPVTSIAGDDATVFALRRAMLESCQQDPAMQFVHANYAAADALSSRAIGSALAGIPGPGRWSLTPRILATIEGVPVARSLRNLDVRPARSFADLVAAERIISETEPLLLLEANDWQAAALPMPTLEADYRRHGLTRARRLFLAEIDGRAVGFGLAEVSSPGMNVQEDFSCARIWVARGASVNADTVRHALLRTLGEVYCACGRPTWHLIANRDQETVVAPLAVQSLVPFVEATVRRDTLAHLSAIWAQMARAPTPSNSNPVACAA